jgi:transcriptional regulator GlxA family with amidase domain
VAELCAAVGVPGRTLRRLCAEHNGLTPHRYQRRLHPAQKVLAAADPATASVTAVAAQFGFGELGRFAGDYLKLFGEASSATLRRRPKHR